ncbi:M15 family metallopeptidase [Actinomadura atramentaria]|uniref:M15 family metallopeptidase n=1 Tax=Actinomadura atramentaria TaxID=1990 RepID=UPI000374B2EC|nr:M15 family metallopeptidase [Actinomadura atramentaria]
MPGTRTLLRVAAAGVALIAAAGCGQGSGGSGESATATPPTASGAPSPTTQSTAPEGFRASIKRVTAADLPHSWHKGCPVAPSGLRMIEMTFWGMDHRTHTGGQLVVNARAADDLVKVFRKLYDDRYPIRRMEPVDVYKGSDFDSIEAGNTSAFNCRNATGSGSWSQHAYGLAVDLNTCENPYVTAGGEVAHKNCARFKNRELDEPGVIHDNDRTVKAFRSIGWGWGGVWTGAKDYQHFSSNGR